MKPSSGELIAEAIAKDRAAILELLTKTDAHTIVYDVSLKRGQNRLIHSPKCLVCRHVKLLEELIK